MKVSLIFILFIVVSSLTISQTASDQYLNQAMKFFDSSELDSAYYYCKLSVEEATKKGKKNSGYMVKAAFLANICLITDRLDEAELYALEAIESGKATVKKDNAFYTLSVQVLFSIYIKKGNFEAAEPVAKEFVEIAAINKNSNPKDYADALELYANVLHFNMKYNDAEKIYFEVLEIKKGIYGENSPEYMGVYRDIANFYVNTERYPEAEKSVKKVLEYDLATYGENSQTYSSTLQDLGIIYFNLARYSLAEPLFIKALEIRKNLYGENDSLYATTLNNLSMLYKATGRFEDSEQGYIRTAKIFSNLKGENSLEFAISLNNLANLYSDLGRYADAEIMLFNSTEIKREVLGVNHPDYATSLNNLAAFYILTNRYDKVENYLQEAIRIKTEFYGENSPSVLTSLSNLASVYEISERYNEAKSLYSNILKVEEEIYGINSVALTSTLTKLAVVNLNMGNYGEAESYFKQSKTLFEVNELQRDPEYSSLLSSLSNLLFIAGDIKGALEVGLKALEIKENIFGNSHPSSGISYFSLARIYESEGNYETADSFYNKYFENRKKIIPGFLLTLSESEKVKYLTEFRENYEVYLSFAGKYFGEIPSIAPSVFENNLFSKGLVFRSALNFMNTLENTQDPGVINLLTNWRNSKAELSRAYSFSKETENYYGINIDSLENRVEELEKSLYIKSYSVQSVEALINPEKIISQINDDEAYIDYFRFRNYNNGSLNDSIVYAAVIIRGVDGSEPLFISLPGGSQIEKFFYPKYKLEMRSENFDEPEEGDDTDFYSVFFKPVRDLTPGVNTFYISPDGVLNKMNLYTLYNPESGKFLIDELTIRTINNPAIFFSDSNKDLEPVSGFFAGYPNYDLMPDTLSLDELFTLSRDIDITPALTDTLTRYSTSLLPGTKTEVLFCDSIFRSSGKLSETAIWDDATEGKIKSITGVSALHIATHGYFEDMAETINERKIMGFEASRANSNPLLRSGLLMTGAAAFLNKSENNPVKFVENGILTAYEAANMNLKGTQLVTLSACETGLGEVVSGEGVYGLQRAFQTAGANAILMSLWKVNDLATQELMTAFYSFWLKGNKKHVALKMAIKKLMNDKRFSNPYYWGAFILAE